LVPGSGTFVKIGVIRGIYINLPLEKLKEVLFFLPD